MYRSLMSVSGVMLCAWAAPAAAQEPFFLLAGETVKDLYGNASASAGDVDGDGVQDIITGAPNEIIGGENRGSASVYSGATRALLYRFEGIREDDFFGGSVAGAGDVDDDGFDDVMVGAQQIGGPVVNPGRVHVYSGATGAEIHLLTGTTGTVDLFGRRLGSMGDVDGDGKSDVYVREQRISQGNRIRLNVYSGASGAVLYFVEGESGDFRYADAVTVLDDLNGDGANDLVVADPDYSEFNPTVRGRVLFYSGRTGAQLGEFKGDDTSLDFARALSPAGDLTGNGRQELLIGTRGLSVDSVQVVSTTSLTELSRIFERFPDDEFGVTLGAAGDVNGDGEPDYVVGAPGNVGGILDAGTVYVLTGLNGEELLAHSGVGINDRLGSSVAGVGDLDGDGRDDVIAGQPHFITTAQTPGLLWGIGLGAGDGSWFRFCRAKPSSSNCQAQLSANSAVSVGPVSGAGDFQVTMTGAEGQRLGIFFSSLAPTALPFFGGRLCAKPPLARGAVFSTGGTLGACDGSATLIINDGDPFPPGGSGFDAGPGGTSIVQAWHRDPLLGDGFDVALSDAMYLTWQ